MTMYWEWLALGLTGLYMLIAFGVRTAIQIRRTGDSGFRGLSGAPGSPEWWAGVLFAVAVLAGFGGPVAGLAGLPELDLLEDGSIRVAGSILAGLGIIGTLVSQVEMGDNWRIGVDEGDRTHLVTAGLFGVVRNPFFTATILTGTGIALLVPNAVAILGWVLLLVAIELQVRVVEEPYLSRHHGQAYQRYLSTAGRFFPRVGLVKGLSVPGTLSPTKEMHAKRSARDTATEPRQ